LKDLEQRRWPKNVLTKRG